MHISVLLNESIDNLNIQKNKIYVDATAGYGGHSFEILKRIGNTGKLVLFDQDINAINILKEKFKLYNNVYIIHSNFENLKEKLENIGINKIDGILFDLGMSSMQIDQTSRGFSYMHDALLDMRMDINNKISAYNVVNEYDLTTLCDIFKIYGEENNYYKISKKIIENRPINTTFDLVKICDMVNYKTKGHSAKRVFQALRIYVNSELDVLNNVLNSLDSLLNINARVCIITFHSGEDKIVKHFFKQLVDVKIDKNIPIAVEAEKKYRLISRKPILPSDFEQKNNSRSRSAKLRVIEKIL